MGYAALSIYSRSTECVVKSGRGVKQCQNCQLLVNTETGHWLSAVRITHKGEACRGACVPPSSWEFWCVVPRNSERFPQSYLHSGRNLKGFFAFLFSLLVGWWGCLFVCLFVCLNCSHTGPSHSDPAAAREGRELRGAGPGRGQGGAAAGMFGGNR